MAKPPAPKRLRVAVAAEHALVVQSVSAALADRGFAAAPVRWPGGVPLPRDPHAPTRYHVGVLLGSGLERPARLAAATLLLSRTPIPWVVLTDAEEPALRGAMYDAGARLVLPSSWSLDALARMLRDLVAGRVAEPPDRAELVEAWDRLRAEREDLLARMDRLTPREREVLMLLHAGETVPEIATLLGVSPSTVRSQVKAIRQKLGVSSQLAAVALYGVALELEAPDPVVDSGSAGGLEKAAQRSSS